MLSTVAQKLLLEDLAAVVVHWLVGRRPMVLNAALKYRLFNRHLVVLDGLVLLQLGLEDHVCVLFVKTGGPRVVVLLGPSIRGRGGGARHLIRRSLLLARVLNHSFLEAEIIVQVAAESVLGSHAPHELRFHRFLLRLLLVHPPHQVQSDGLRSLLLLVALVRRQYRIRRQPTGCVRVSLRGGVELLGSNWRGGSIEVRVVVRLLRGGCGGNGQGSEDRLLYDFNR